jgi:hypothetical protein
VEQTVPLVARNNKMADKIKMAAKHQFLYKSIEPWDSRIVFLLNFKMADL